MQFTSSSFLVFFLVFLILFYQFLKLQPILILLAGLIFYSSFNLYYLPFLFILVTCNYYLAHLLGKQSRQRKKYFILGIIFNVSVLLFFKYKFLLLPKSVFFPFPIGLSFQVFMLVSYLFEVYRRNIKIERNLPSLVAYISFFPITLAGPIERANNLLPQLGQRHNFREENLNAGLRLILWGLFKKLIIADRAAIFVNQVFDNPQFYAGPILLLATYLFAIEIYADFSGYTDIARGLARTLGIKLMDNFKEPYFATSVGDFWRRWHISLTSFLRDYIYLPLGGNRVNFPRWMINVLIVFFISGLWHGERATFLLWGLMLGICLIIEKLLKKLRSKFKGKILFLKPLPSPIKTLITFQLICLSWISFRAGSLSDAFYIYRHLLSGWKYLVTGFSDLVKIILVQGLTAEDFLILFSAIFLLFVFDYLKNREKLTLTLFRQFFWLNWGINYFLILATIFFGEYQGIKFIYSSF